MGRLRVCDGAWIVEQKCTIDWCLTGWENCMVREKWMGKGAWRGDSLMYCRHGFERG